MTEKILNKIKDHVEKIQTDGGYKKKWGSSSTIPRQIGGNVKQTQTRLVSQKMVGQYTTSEQMLGLCVQWYLKSTYETHKCPSFPKCQAKDAENNNAEN